MNEKRFGKFDEMDIRIKEIEEYIDDSSVEDHEDEIDSFMDDFQKIIAVYGHNFEQTTVYQRIITLYEEDFPQKNMTDILILCKGLLKNIKRSLGIFTENQVSHDI